MTFSDTSIASAGGLPGLFSSLLTLNEEAGLTRLIGTCLNKTFSGNPGGGGGGWGTECYRRVSEGSQRVAYLPHCWNWVEIPDGQGCLFACLSGERWL